MAQVILAQGAKGPIVAEVFIAVGAIALIGVIAAITIKKDLNKKRGDYLSGIKKHHKKK